MSSRRVMLEKLAGFARELRSGAYFVRRGVINWPSFDFVKHPRALSVLHDTGTLMRPDQQDGKLALEFGMQVRMDPEDSLDDALLDELYEDAELIIRRLGEAKDDRGNGVCDIVGPTIEVVDWSDVKKKLQGIVVTFDVHY